VLEKIDLTVITAVPIIGDRGRDQRFYGIVTIKSGQRSSRSAAYTSLLFLGGPAVNKSARLLRTLSSGTQIKNIPTNPSQSDNSRQSPLQQFPGSRAAWLCALLAAFVFLSAAAYGQNDVGTIVGYITDQTGARCDRNHYQ
jgi:hypothetical protein